MEAALTEEMLAYIANIRAARPLQTLGEKAAAAQLVDFLGLEGHHDPQKNWDTLKCLAYLLDDAFPGGPVLDAGSGDKAVILRWLHRLGRRDLYACDIAPAKSEALQRYGIRFTRQDLTATTYPDEFFAAVTSISVIEHNVPLEAFVREMRRILKPGGLLLVSTDYWPEPVDCSGIYPYGEAAGEMKLFDRVSIAEFIGLAEAASFELCEAPSFAAQERAVRWERVDRDYTFFFVAFRKTG